MFSNCETGTVPKIIRRNILNRRDNNISNNLEPVSMEHTCYTNAGRKSSETNDPANIVPSKDTASTSVGAMSSNVHQNLLDKNSSKKAEDVKCLHKRQVEDKLEQIREYISITTSIICNMRKTDEQNDPTPDDSERLEQMVHELKDSEHKLIRILESWNQSVQVPLPDADSDLAIQVVSSTTDIVDYKDEAACLELQTPLVVEQEEVLQKQSGLDLLNKAMFPILNESLRNNPSSQVEAIQELEDRLDTWNKTQINRMNLQEHLDSQVEMLGDTINHLRSDSDTRRDIMQILDQKDSSLQAEHVSLQSKLLELQTKKQQVDQLVEQLHVLNGHKSDDEDVGNQVRRIVSVKDQLSKLKDMLYSIQSIEAIEKPSEVPSLCNPTTFLENIAPESMDATLRIRNDVRNSSGLHLVGPLQEQANLLRHTQKQVNDKATNSIDRQRSLQAELQAKKHELEELMSKRKATSNLNHDGNSDKSSLGLYNSLYYDYNHKEQYSSDEISDDEANELDADMKLSVGSLNKNQMPQSQSHINHQHLIPERLVPQQQAGTSQQQDSWMVESRPQHQLVFDEDRRQSASTKGIFIGDPNSYCREQNGQDTSRMQRIQIQKQLELIRNVCDSMLIEHSIHPAESIEQDNFNNQQPSQSIQHQQIQNRKNHTPSPLCSEPLSYNNTCGTPDNQANQINILHGDQSSQIGGMTPIITNMSGGAKAKMGIGGNRGRMIGNSMLGIGGGDYPEGLQTVQGSNGYNRNMKPTSSTNSDQTSTIWQQQQQWLVNNTLQSQAFIMNTLNQCCQMMWLQQREIQSLRNAVQNMQLQNQNNSPVSNNQQQRFSNLQGGPSTPYANTSANSAFTYAIAGPSGSSLSHQQQQLPGVQCSGVQKSNPNLLEMLNPNIQGGGFPSSFPNTMLGESLDANHAADFIGSRSSNSATVHRSNMTPMSDCLNNCSNNNLSNVNMNNVMPGGNNLASNSNPQIWHERSLNNQLHQGNIRANNYWDNFRR